MGERVVKFDDMDQSEADVETVYFSLGKDTYQIDLSQRNRDKLERALKPFMDAASKPTRSHRTVTHRRTTTDADAKAIRAWAAENNIKVNARGRISADLVQHFLAANSH